MGRWLKELEIMTETHLTKPTKEGSVSFVGTASVSFQKNNGTEDEKKAALFNLILGLKRYCGGDDSEWVEYANDVINDWSHNLDEAITHFENARQNYHSALKIIRQ